jgi:hypothetical protein
MSEQPFIPPPDHDDEAWEQRVRTTARRFQYPPTPNISAAVRQRLAKPTPRWNTRRLRVVWATLLAALVIVLAVPDVRARVLEFIRIGVVNIIFIEPTATLTPTPTPPATRALDPTAAPRPTATRLPDPDALASVLLLPGRATLAAAQERLGSPIPLPAYPADLGAPDRVFVQDFDGPVISLVWLKPGTLDQVRLIMEILPPNMVANKLLSGDSLQTVTVAGQSAAWLSDAHVIAYFAPRSNRFLERLTLPHVLIWRRGDHTLRLEGDLPLTEAVRIAESLR